MAACGRLEDIGTTAQKLKTPTSRKNKARNAEETILDAATVCQATISRLLMPDLARIGKIRSF
jgi:hypothetical protein